MPPATINIVSYIVYLVDFMNTEATYYNIWQNNDILTNNEFSLGRVPELHGRR